HVTHLDLLPFPTRRSSDLSMLYLLTLCNIFSLALQPYLGAFSEYLCLNQPAFRILADDLGGRQTIQHRFQRGAGVMEPELFQPRSEEHPSELQSRFDLV